MKSPLMKIALALTVTTALCTAAQAATITETKITASDGVSADLFGGAVAISGNTAIVGAFGYDGNGRDSGSAYLLDTSTGDQIAKLTASDGAEYDWFGSSVAVSGNTAIVGARNDADNGMRSGSAYLFDATTGDQIAKLTASDAATNKFFGYSVAISGDMAIVGGYADEGNGGTSRSAYLFDATSGDQIARLTTSDEGAYDTFGNAVAVYGDTAIVGADGDLDYSGSAYLFDVTTGDQIAKLTASDGAMNDRFGHSVAISGNTAIVGAYADDDDGRTSGSAYLFDVTTGDQIAKLTASDAAAGEFFGYSVAISGNTAIVGAFGDDQNGGTSGAAYLFDVTTGDQIAKLTASDAAKNDQFGRFVAISGNTAIIGSIFDDDNGYESGSVYLYTIETAAVPLPAGVWLLGSALGALALRRRGRG